MNFFSNFFVAVAAVLLSRFLNNYAYNIYKSFQQ